MPNPTPPMQGVTDSTEGVDLDALAVRSLAASGGRGFADGLHSQIIAKSAEPEYASDDFQRGAQACREMMARFVEQGGDAATAASIRANWHPGWNTDPGAPPAVIDTWEAQECPEGEASYAAWVASDPVHTADANEPPDPQTVVTMLERWAIPMLPANRHGQIPFMRGMIESAIRELKKTASRTPPPVEGVDSVVEAMARAIYACGGGVDPDEPTVWATNPDAAEKPAWQVALPEARAAYAVIADRWQEGREAERADVVEHLHGQGEIALAVFIERGDHLPQPPATADNGEG